MKWSRMGKQMRNCYTKSTKENHINEVLKTSKTQSVVYTLISESK